MELATPLPSTVVLPPSSSRNSSLPSPISLASSKRSSSRSHDSHPSTRRSSPSVSALLSPFATSADPIGVVETTSPPAAVGLLIDLDDTEDSRANAGVDLQSRSLVVLDSEEGEHGRRLGDDKLLHSQFRLSELELAHEAHEVEDNDATVRPGPPASHLRPLLPGSSSPRPSTPGQVVRRLEEAGEDVIDELRDMILELMPDLRRGEGEAESS
ncbi:hypothetical protein L218DRAFT_634132 [Marasmius fiardii PR-910]|nr:hypothetical protein L218DRAFT_634132 [Marasmius fiardii PR-910]